MRAQSSCFRFRPRNESAVTLRLLFQLADDRGQTIFESVTDLSALEGMPLKNLSLDGEQADISPLHGMPLEVLELRKTAVSDLRVLRDMALKDLDLWGSEKLQDLTPLADCLTLERLKLPTQYQDIEFLRKLPKLQRLSYDDGPWEKALTAAQFWKEYDAKKGKEGGGRGQ